MTSLLDMMSGRVLVLLAAIFVGAVITLDSENRVLSSLTMYVLGNDTPWHTGEAWDQFLSLYDERVASSLGHCTHELLRTRFGETMAHMCG